LIYNEGPQKEGQRRLLVSLLRAFGRNDSMNAREREQKKIAFFGHFNLTNFGNESTFSSTIFDVTNQKPTASSIRAASVVVPRCNRPTNIRGRREPGPAM
jgi:hypothetical protein